MTWSNSTPDFWAVVSPCSQSVASSEVPSIPTRSGPRRRVPGAAKTEPPTEGGWFLVGCPARSAPPSADESKLLSRESFPEFLLRGGKVLSFPHRPKQKDRPEAISVWRSANGDRQIKKAAGSPCGPRVKIECV
jgi:hypothetical protein